MAEFILQFLFEANAALALFALIYILVLRNLTDYGYLRAYLVVSVLFSLIVASVNISIEQVVQVERQVNSYSLHELIPVFENISETMATSTVSPYQWLLDHFSLLNTTLLGLLVIGFFLTAQIAFQYVALNNHLKNNSTYVDSLGVFINDRFGSAFTFRNRIYVPNTLLKLAEKDLDKIIAHERLHITYGHAFDVGLMLFMRSIFWFNPIYWFLLKELKAVQEFQVDDHLTKDLSKEDYSRLLINLNQSKNSNNLIFPFSKNLIKKRVVKLNQLKSSSMKRGLFLMIIPIAGIMFYGFSVHHVQRVQPSKINPIVDQSNNKFMLPISLDKVTRFSPYGLRKDPFNNGEKMHEGIDLVAAKGTPVLASASGEVTQVTLSNSGHGNRIEILHEGGVSSFYSHLDEVFVSKGQTVEQGAKIGSCGSTGLSTGPHLHFEIEENGVKADPETYISIDGIKLMQTKVDKENLVILIDAGHGGQDLGSHNESVSEKEIVLQYAKELAQQLKNANYDVELFRDSDADLSLTDRALSTENREEALLISLHLNQAENQNAQGIELYIPKSSEKHNLKNKKIGASMLAALNEKDLKERGIKTADFYLLKNAHCPAVLVELGFLSNSQELEKLQSEDYSLNLCSALVNGIDLYAQ